MHPQTSPPSIALSAPGHVSQQRMADLLSAVKTVRSQSDATSEPALTPVITTQRKTEATVKGNGSEDELRSDAISSHQTTIAACSTPEDALQLLRLHPDTTTFLSILSRLCSDKGFDKAFSLSAPGPLQAQLVNTLLTTNLPAFWPILGDKDRALLIACVTNITGINAVIARLRTLATQASTSTSESDIQSIKMLVEVLGRCLRGDDAVAKLCQGLHGCLPDGTKRQIVWKDLVNVLASGKVISVTAQAEDVVVRAKLESRAKPSWLSIGPDYAAWLGRNIAKLAVRLNESISVEASSQLLAKSLSLGHPSSLLKGFFPLMAASEDRLMAVFQQLPSYSRRKLLEMTMRWLSEIAPSDAQNAISPDCIGAMAALFAVFHRADSSTCQILTSLVGDAAFNASISLSVRRAAVTVMATSSLDELQALLEKTMTTFGDRLFIDHAPILQQENLAQNLLLAAGYLHRETPMAVLLTARSQGHMQGTSNRLDTSSQRARWLGMAVATAVSSLVDKEGAKMDFHVDEMKTDEAKWYVDLVHVRDQTGTLQDFEALIQAQDRTVKLPRRSARIAVDQPQKLNGKPVFGPPRPPEPAQPSQTEIVGEKVTELLDDVSDDDDDLKPYAKPDSDPEDSDEDASLVNRNKPRAPVYIRDLMRFLNDDKDPNRFQLGIKHAAPLVRRKSTFGNEVKDHSEELLRTLCNLQDPFSTDNFDEFRLQAMIAVLLADIDTLAPWFSKQAFAGEYSLSQRCIMLAALGLAGRELAGLQNEDALNPAITNTDFPTKRLPPRLHALYAPTLRPLARLNTAYKTEQHHLLQPLALEAADKSTSHLNAIKVRTFSSRLTDNHRTKRHPPPNNLAKIFTTTFFYPLLTQYQRDVAAYSSSSIWTTAPILLTTYLKTLTLLLHASGPATLHLPTLSSNFWDFLLSLRTQAGMDISVLEAVLFGLLTLLEVNTDHRRLAEEQAKQLMATQEWVGLVFENFGGREGEVSLVGSGAGEEEEKVRALSAGVLVKCGAVHTMDHSHMDHSHGGMGHGDMGHGDMGHGDQPMCSMNVHLPPPPPNHLPQTTKIQIPNKTTPHLQKQMLFTWSTKNLCIIFPSWRITGVGSLILSLLAVAALTAGYEAVREASRQYEQRLAARLASTPRGAVRAGEQKGRVVKAVLYGVQVFYSFFIMLLFMTYNGWVMIAVGVGATIGFLLFSGSSVQKSAACH
ncbi:DNA replication checkpoint protein tel2 [Teratosphaeria destructans]|uniref:DNA replication checkpoint protein tel2 n=1 Tax=Teratosphaeria destructans TaxID=418781 RepID=A0A9W7SPF1_9PEZI|nr:DNA replication checkpoint protein tel2 [Teratosphaeria destructans]